MTEKLSSTFGDWLYKQMERKGWSSLRLSDEADISPTMISMLRSGDRVPSRNTVEKVGRALGSESGALIAAGLIPDDYVAVKEEGSDILLRFNNAPPDVQDAVRRILEIYPTTRSKRVKVRVSKPVIRTTKNTIS